MAFRLAFGSDHAGFELKKSLVDWAKSAGHSVVDLGCHDLSSVDYPDFGKAVAEAVAGGEADRGVLVCGSGIGISIAANRHPGVRAALCHDVTSAALSRQHNDANVIALGARLIGVAVATDCLARFLSEPFEGGRHQRRVEKLG